MSVGDWPQAEMEASILTDTHRATARELGRAEALLDHITALCSIVRGSRKELAERIVTVIANAKIGKEGEKS